MTEWSDKFGAAKSSPLLLPFLQEAMAQAAEAEAAAALHAAEVAKAGEGEEGGGFQSEGSSNGREDSEGEEDEGDETETEGHEEGRSGKRATKTRFSMIGLPSNSVRGVCRGGQHQASYLWHHMCR